MIIPRLLALGALAYAGLRLRRRLGRDGSGERMQGPTGGEEAVRDVLVEDPVCGRLVPSREALTLETAGGLRHFCGEACRLAYQLQTGRTRQSEHTQGERTA